METRVNNGIQIAVFMDFENIATSAEATLGNFDVNAIMDLLRTRGRLLIKRAYGDWGRYQRYRRDMLESGVDLFQLYTVGIQQKNRADVRLAIDAIETVFTRPNIDLYAVVSGDSDFTELIHKLRDHGKYTIGIGLRSATSDLLRRACDEFIFYETLVSEELDDISDELRLPDARDLLRRALGLAEQKGEVPVFAGRLKQIMLGLDPSFNEANYGFQQFRAFLEAHQDLVKIDEQGLQLYVGLHRPAPAGAGGGIPTPVHPAVDQAARESSLGQRYRSFLREASLRLVERGTRMQVLRDFLTLVESRPDSLSLSTTADLLKDRYDAENALTPKIAVPEMMRLLIMSGALDFAGGNASSSAPLTGAGELNIESLAMACDAVYVWRLVEGGVPVFVDQLAPVLLGSDTDPAPVAALCQTLIDRGRIVSNAGSYAVASTEIDRLLARPELQLPVADMAHVALPSAADSLPASTAPDAGYRGVGARTAENLFREASDLRQRDFAGSALRYLQAARLQLDALKEATSAAKAVQSRPGFDDLKWYLASYCSVKAGHAFVTGDYADAEPYYLAFFGLAQEADGVWPRIQRLVNPMGSYYCALAGKQLGENVPPNLGRSPSGQVALQIHNHPQPAVGARWEELMERLAIVNLGLVRQAHCESLAKNVPGPHSAVEDAARIERTRDFLANLIARREAEEAHK